MKLSVVIPTRNRLELLKKAVISVLEQKDDNWELIISDNASTEDIQGYIKNLNNPRIKYFRSEISLSITESWNRCIDQSTGDYLLMIGDDDILLKNHFQIMRKLLEKYDHPELIYSNAYLYAYPGVLSLFPKGVFQPFGSLYGMPKKEFPFWLDLECKQKLVQETLGFRSIYSTNMQHVLIKRSLFEKVKRNNQFFHSPYPDIYAMSALLMEASRILIYPKESVVIGISSKSHGCYAINRNEQAAMDLLNIKNEMSDISSLKKVVLPGFIVFTYWLGTIELFNLYFPLKKYGLFLDYKIYRNEQINYILYYYLSDKNKYKNEFKSLMKKLKFSEVLSTIIPRLWFDFIDKSGLTKKFLWIFRPKKAQIVPETTSYTPLNPPPGYIMPDTEPNPFSTILEVFQKVEAVDCT